MITEIVIPYRHSETLENFLNKAHIPIDKFFEGFYLVNKELSKLLHKYEWRIYNTEIPNKLLSHITFQDVWQITNDWFSDHVIYGSHETKYLQEPRRREAVEEVDEYCMRLLDSHDGLIYIESVETIYPYQGIGLQNYLFKELTTCENYERHMMYLECLPFGKSEQMQPFEVVAGFYDKWGFHTDEYIENEIIISDENKGYNRFLIRDL